MERSSVDFPEPTRPRIAIVSPAFTSSDTSFSAASPAAAEFDAVPRASFAEARRG